MAMPKGERTDKTQCRQCKQREPAIVLVRIKGKPKGECKDCNRLRQSRARAQASWHLGLYRAMPALVGGNLRTLETLPPGSPRAYTLACNVKRVQIGYIIVLFDTIFVSVRNRTDLFHFDLFGVASYLGNLNAFIDCNAAADSSHGNAPRIDPSQLQGIEAIDVQERLAWLDRTLQDRAMRLLRSETSKARAVNAAIARSKNPA